MTQPWRSELVASARQQLWREGRALEYLLDDRDLTRPDTGGQQGWVRRLDASPEGSTTVWMISRQRGKSFAWLARAFFKSVQHPGRKSFYAAQTGKGATGIIASAAEKILEDIAPELKPHIDSNSGRIEFPNGSLIEWEGTDSGQFRRRRGRSADDVGLDEFAFYSAPLEVESVCLPMLQTTGGRLTILSSPPESPAHEMVARYRAAQASGLSEFATIHDNPRMGPAKVAAFAAAEAARLGLTVEQLYASTYWRREYLAEIVTEESRQVVPTWSEAAAVELVGDWQRPQYFDGYVSIDVGGVGKGDPSALLAGFHDPATSTLTIEDELELRDVVGNFALGAKAREDRLWGTSRWDGTLLGAEEYLRGLNDAPEFLRRAISTAAPRQPYLRVGDNDMLVLATLSQEHGYTVMPTAKHDLHMAVDSLAQGVGQRRLRIHRRCRRLVEQLYTTLWNRQRTQFERTARDHGDLVAALVYLWRNVRWHRDCRPPVVVTDSTGWAPKQHPSTKFAALTRRMR